MKSSTGRWVSGDNFFDRSDELDRLEALVKDGNHILLTGQRRMGKTSVARELGARLESQGWGFVFADIEGARDEGEAVSAIASAAYALDSVRSKLLSRMKRWLGKRVANVDELGVHDVRVRFRAMLTDNTWQREGHEIVRLCADHSAPVLLVLDELPIFLSRLLSKKRGAERADEFLSWLRAAFQAIDGPSPVLFVSGSIGLGPLVKRLGIPDRINYLHTVRLEAWSRKVSNECLRRLAAAYGLSLEAGAEDAVYDRLGTGVPQHVQSFFARLRASAAASARSRIGIKDVEDVYQNEMLAATGQSELWHYDARLRDALGDARSYEIACMILAEAATEGVLTPTARQVLESHYSTPQENAVEQVAQILDILVHDGYLAETEDGHQILSNWLRDWWKTRVRNHHRPLESRPAPPKRSKIGF